MALLQHWAESAVRSLRVDCCELAVRHRTLSRRVLCVFFLSPNPLIAPSRIFPAGLPVCNLHQNVSFLLYNNSIRYLETVSSILREIKKKCVSSHNFCMLDLWPPPAGYYE